MHKYFKVTADIKVTYLLHKLEHNYIAIQKLNVVLQTSKKKEPFNKVFFVALDAFQTLDRPLQHWRKRGNSQSKSSILNLAAYQQAYFQTVL